MEKAEPFLKTLADVAPDEQGRVQLADFYAQTDRIDEAKRNCAYASITESHADTYVTSQLRLADLGACRARSREGIHYCRGDSCEVSAPPRHDAGEGSTTSVRGEVQTRHTSLKTFESRHMLVSADGGAGGSELKT